MRVYFFHSVTSDIQYWDPKKNALVHEKVYGEKWLRFTYENWIGKIGLWALVKRAWFSKWYGKRMSHPDSASKIAPFIKNYGLDTNEFLHDPHSFHSFNEFFYRKLAPNARPIAESDSSLVFPADGRHLVIPDISKVGYIYAKGQSFDLKTLLQSPEYAEEYKEGSMLISRLCPVDYHRFHFPASGKLEKTSLINGDLLSVNPIALSKRISIFWENKRYLSFLETKTIGKIAQLLVGATCVGSVHLTAKEGSNVQKGEEYGYFSFGGSCVITLFPPGSIRFDKSLLEWSEKGVETYSRMGEKMADVITV